MILDRRTPADAETHRLPLVLGAAPRDRAVAVRLCERREVHGEARVGIELLFWELQWTDVNVSLRPLEVWRATGR